MNSFDHLVILIVLAVAILGAQTIIVVMLFKMRTAQSALIARETQRAIPHMRFGKSPASGRHGRRPTVRRSTNLRSSNVALRTITSV